MNEIWKDIEGYEGLYQVSSMGRVRGLKRFSYRKDGSRPYPRAVKIKAIQKSISGYSMVQLWKNGKSKFCTAHRLVALAFIPNPKNLPQVNHKDLNKENNCVSNLEWIDGNGNMKHAKEHGRIKGSPGGKHYLAKLTAENVHHIRRKEMSHCEYARLYKVDPSTVHNVCSGKTWKHLLPQN